jgi:chemotaxis protein MotB
MQTIKTAVLATSLVALAGCASWDKSPICHKTHGWTAWSDVRCTVHDASNDEASRFSALEKERQRLANELDAAKKENATLNSRVSDLERQLVSTQGDLTQSQRQLAASMALAAGLQAGAGDTGQLEAELAAARQRNAELESQLAALRGELDTEMAKLKEAQRGLIRALRPEIEKGDITVDLNNERLLINLASGYLFGSGQDELKPAGADALKHVGAVLKDFPEYKVAVEGHTDNRPIHGALKKKFPTNMQLSESRAANAAKALTEGGLGAATTHGYADTKPVESNNTNAGRAKNRRVEIRVTK